MLPSANPIPTQLVLGRSASTKVNSASAAIYGASRKKLTPTSFWARRSAASDDSRPPVKRQITIALAASSPNPARIRSAPRCPRSTGNLGLSRIEDTLPYARLVRGSLDGQMEKLDTIFTDLVQPADIAA